MRRPVLLRILVASLLQIVGHSAPYFLVQNSRPYCVTVEGPRGTELVLKYNVPDMVRIPEDDSEKHEKDAKGGEGEGLDKRFNERYKQRLEAMRRAGRQMSDISIVMQQRGETAGSAREWRRRQSREDRALDKQGSGRLREEITELEGTIRYRTGGIDGPVEICVQSMSASQNAPQRVALNVTQQIENPQRQGDGKAEGQQLAKSEFSKMAGDMASLERKVQLMLTNADYAKEQEVTFHEQSIAMNRASKYWPIIHLIVLLVTGFTQANHIVRFFKSHHIF